MAELKFGRRPPKNAPALRLGPSLTGVIPAHPANVDYLSKLSNWKMLGNDTYGDCVAVTWANLRRLTTATLAFEAYPIQSQVYALYKTQNPAFPAEDNGMDIQTCLEYLASTGGPDGVKALAFASVDHTNRDEMDAAIAIFGGVWVGINVLNANMNEFDAGQPWDYSNSPIDGGHSVVVGGYNTATPNADLRFITWAQETSFTDSYISHEFEEAWVVIWPEHLGSKAFQEGVNLSQLASDYTALTGRPFPASPVADPDTTLANAVRVWAYARHSGTNRLAALAVQAWLKAKSLYGKEGVTMTHRGPYRPSHFQPQNPTLSGCAAGWRCCTTFSFAMAGSQGSRHSVELTGCQVFHSTGDTSGGITLDECVPIMRQHGVSVDTYHGDISTYGVAVNLQSGRAAAAQGNTKPLLSTSHRSTGGPINHCVVFAGTHGGTVGHPDTVDVYDPAADGRHVAWGTAAQGPQTWPWALALAFMAALRPWGDGDPRTLGPGRAYVALFPDTEPHYHSLHGGVPTSPFPDTLRGRSGASLPARRIRPGPGTQYAPIGTLQPGQVFSAYQWMNGVEVDGRIRWYGSHDGDQWIAAAGITGEGGT